MNNLEFELPVVEPEIDKICPSNKSNESVNKKSDHNIIYSSLKNQATSTSCLLNHFRPPELSSFAKESIQVKNSDIDKNKDSEFSFENKIVEIQESKPEIEYSIERKTFKKIEKLHKINRKKHKSKKKSKDRKLSLKQPIKSTIAKSLTLKEAIAKVCEWRSFCFSIGNKKKGKKSMTKEAAAKLVDIKKKSLDDYLMFLRLGIAINYDFKANLIYSFNTLRKYIKGIKNRTHWKKGLFKDVESLQDI